MTRTLYSALLAAMLFLSASAFAVQPDEVLEDASLEARARALSAGLRCLVCQNQSIEDSNATLARDLRRVVRERILAGDSDDEVRDYMVARYGDWVLLQPPFKLETLALWIGPFVLLGLGGLGILLGLRRRRTAVAGEMSEGPAPLSADEQTRLDSLLKDEG